MINENYLIWQRIQKKHFIPKPKDAVPYLNFSNLENAMATIEKQVLKNFRNYIRMAHGCLRNKKS